MLEPTYCRTTAYYAFTRALPELETAQGLFRTAFAISLHERPEASLSEAEEIIDKLRDLVRARVRSLSGDALLAHLHDVLFDVFGLRGNVEDYYNPANSYLGDVLQMRRGLPITLVLIYKVVAEPLGIRVHGLNSPGHFLAWISASEYSESEDSEKNGMIIDPFFQGGLLTPEEATDRINQATGRSYRPADALFPRASHVQWISRMLLNLQAAFLSSGQERNQLAMLELQSLLSDRVST